eukprot:jgi/Bigna1/73291/fgenesh1_pg.23_\
MCTVSMVIVHCSMWIESSGFAEWTGTGRETKWIIAQFSSGKRDQANLKIAKQTSLASLGAVHTIASCLGKTPAPPGMSCKLSTHCTEGVKAPMGWVDGGTMRKAVRDGKSSLGIKTGRARCTLRNSYVRMIIEQTQQIDHIRLTFRKCRSGVLFRSCQGVASTVNKLGAPEAGGQRGTPSALIVGVGPDKQGTFWHEICRYSRVLSLFTGQVRQRMAGITSTSLLLFCAILTTSTRAHSHFQSSKFRRDFAYGLFQEVNFPRQRQGFEPRATITNAPPSDPLFSRREFLGAGIATSISSAVSMNINLRPDSSSNFDTEAKSVSAGPWQGSATQFSSLGIKLACNTDLRPSIARLQDHKPRAHEFRPSILENDISYAPRRRLSVNMVDHNRETNGASKHLGYNHAMDMDLERVAHFHLFPYR